MRLKELDALRGMAALFVVFFHCTMFRPQAEYGFFLGMSGVDLFFIISGFVIFMSLEKSASGKHFIIARFIRLYPTYWLIATITFILYWVLHRVDSPVPYTEISISQFLVNLSMVQYYFDVPNMSGSYWTLIIELLFYVLIYIIFRLKGLRHIVFIGAMLNLLIFLLFFSISKNWIPDYTHYYPLLYHFPLFYIGILFYKSFLNRTQFPSFLPLIAVSIVLQLYLHDYGRDTQFMSLEWYATMLIIYSGLFTLIVYRKLGFIVNRISVFFGEISYSLYLIHQPIVYCIIIPLLTDELGYNFWFSLSIAVPTAILVAGLITYYVEIPIRRALRKKWISSTP